MRTRAVTFLVLVFVVGLIGDRFVGAGRAAASRVPPPPIPALAPSGALSSTWYCPALGATAQSPTRGRIIVANPSANDLHVTATFAPAIGPTVSRDAVVAAYSRLTLKLEDEAPSAYTATSISISGDQGGVEQEIQGPLGQSISPCTTTASNHWYFASGRTDTGATMLASVYNPFSADAVIDMTFATDQGGTTPDAFQGIVVPAGKQRVINIGDKVRLRTAVAAALHARSGQVIVDKLLIQSGNGNPAPEGSTPFKGMSVTLGAAALGTTWYFPDGVKAPGVTEHFEFYNPGASEAHVQASPSLEQGTADPFTLTVPPGDRVSLQVDQEARVPANVGQAWVVTSDLPVASERIYEELSPAPRVGVADSTGASQLGTRWLFPAGSAASGADEYLILFNPGPKSAPVTVTGSGRGDSSPLPSFTLAPGTRKAIRVGESDPSGLVVLQVDSPVPVVAERSQAVVGAPGLSGSIGIIGGTRG